MTSWMYILECQDSSYYVGKANDLHFRMREHSGAVSSNRLSRYVSKRGFRRLVYYERFESEALALERESELKKWHPLRYSRTRLTPVRAYKEYLVKNFPAWKLDAFHATVTDLELQWRLNAGGSVDFVPQSPAAWWEADTQSRPQFWYARGEFQLAEAARRAWDAELRATVTSSPPSSDKVLLRWIWKDGQPGLFLKIIVAVWAVLLLADAFGG